MLEENVDMIRRVYAAAAARDEAAPLISFSHPEIELDVSQAGWGDLTGQSVYHGHEGLRTLFREWYGAWMDYEDDLEDLIDAGDKVVALVTSRGRGRASGVPVELKTPAVWTIREGRIIRVEWFQTPGKALEAAGLKK
jgi:ketosteroid isomerase-like protein